MEFSSHLKSYLNDKEIEELTKETTEKELIDIINGSTDNQK